VTLLDRYILAHLFTAFGFFLLIFTGVVWLTQAVRLIDTVVNSGRGAGIFLEFSALVLPQVFVIVLPLAGIGAALYAVNRLYGESELVVMMASGLGPRRLLRPLAVFGIFLLVAMAIVTTVLVPRGSAHLADRTREVRSDIANALIVERQFIHPAPGLTLFIEDTSRVGEMAGIFLQDQRDAARPVTYSAERALLVREADEARLVMVDGVALTPGAAGTQINAVEFDQFVFDLSELVQTEAARAPRPEEYSVAELLDPSPLMLVLGDRPRGAYIAEGHYKLVLPLLAALHPMIALVTLLAGNFRRGGFGRRVIVAIVLSVGLQVAVIVARTIVQDGAALWPVMYAPALLGGGYVGVMLIRLNAARRPARAPA
jgi:lipopolysaccharide export system permease protein